MRHWHFVGPRHGQDSDGLIRAAYTAVIARKEGGRGQFCVFAGIRHLTITGWIQTCESAGKRPVTYSLSAKLLARRST